MEQKSEEIRRKSLARVSYLGIRIKINTPINRRSRKRSRAGDIALGVRNGCRFNENCSRGRGGIITRSAFIRRVKLPL